MRIEIRLIYMPVGLVHSPGWFMKPVTYACIHVNKTDIMLKSDVCLKHIYQEDVRRIRPLSVKMKKVIWFMLLFNSISGTNHNTINTHKPTESYIRLNSCCFNDWSGHRFTLSCSVLCIKWKFYPLSRTMRLLSTLSALGAFGSLHMCRFMCCC